MSYSHDSVRHKEWVRGLAEHLCKAGIDPILDQWDLAPGQDIVAFMSDGISSSNRVILVCTKDYVAKSNSRSSGVGYEDMMISAVLSNSTDTKKFLPIIRDNPDSDLPQRLGSRRYIDFSEDSDYTTKLDELMREVLGKPAIVKPRIGGSPFEEPPTHQPAPTIASRPVEELLSGDEDVVRERCRVLCAALHDHVDGRLYEIRVDHERRYALPNSLYDWHLDDSLLVLLRASGEAVTYLIEYGYLSRGDDFIQLTARGWETKRLRQVHSLLRKDVFEDPLEFPWYRAWRRKGEELKARQARRQ